MLRNLVTILHLYETPTRQCDTSLGGTYKSVRWVKTKLATGSGLLEVKLQPTNVRTALRHVTNPAIWRVSDHVLGHSQVPDLQIGNVVHGDFKAHVDGSNLLPNGCCARFRKC
jgi:hypothetical protein